MFIIAFKNEFAYRGSVIFHIIGSIFKIFVSIALWRYIYSYDTSMINYMTLYVISSNIIGMFYRGTIADEIGGKVSNGTFALELIRPENFIYLGYLKMLGQVCAAVLMRGIPVLLVFLPMILRVRGIINLDSIIFVILVVALGNVLFAILYTLIGFMAFLCFEIWPFTRLMNDTIRFLSGSFLPLALFPGWLRVISDFLPFRFLYSLPIDILLGTVDTGQIIPNLILMCVWIFGLGVLLVIIYKKAVNIFVVQGG